MKKTMKTISAFALITILFTVAFAAITIDDNGVGFVGKGDVQLAFGWNNAQLQSNASGVSFKLTDVSETVTEVSWQCTNSNNENIQQRERTTTSSSSTVGLLESVARVRNQITGFNINGFEGEPDGTPPTTSTDGPQLNSCPSGPWSLTTPAGDPVVVSDSSSRTLTISHNSTDVTIDLDN